MQATDEHLKLLGLSIGQLVWVVIWQRTDDIIGDYGRVDDATIHHMTIDDIECIADNRSLTGTQQAFYVWYRDDPNQEISPTYIELKNGEMQSSSSANLFVDISVAKETVMRRYIDEVEEGLNALREATRVCSRLRHRLNCFREEHVEELSHELNQRLVELETRNASDG